jgi:glycopeptide antibiotics resistance protein
VLTYNVYNLATTGSLILLFYIFVDILLIDFFRKTKRNNVRRVIFYSFLFYSINLLQLISGGVVIPLQNESAPLLNYTNIGDWFGIYGTIDFKTSYWSPFSLFYNLVLFIPLGIYISMFFNIKSVKKIIFIILLACIGIETIQYVFKNLGLVNKQGFIKAEFIYLILNFSGGVLGYVIYKLISKIIKPIRDASKSIV